MTVRPSKKRGSSLVEVLLALLILAVLMAGILQMFALALITDFGSAERSEMTFKAQEVVEILRWVAVLRKSGQTGPSEIPTFADGVVSLPWDSTASSFWGPSGANVVEQDNLPYQISYRCQSGAGPGSGWTITVSVVPAPVTGGSVPTRLYLGSGSAIKRVDYVAQIPQ